MKAALESAIPVQLTSQTGGTLPPDSITIRALLKELIDPARILIRPIERVAFASDASFYRLIPRAVIQPKTAEEIKHLFRFSHQHRVPLVFRAGGTSLSGQSITDGILVDIGRYWRGVRVEQAGKTIRLQPGLIGHEANQALQLYARKIGPDPASIASCRIGGILANNASGMCCGVAQNAYHTLDSLTFILPSGTQIDTADPNADNIFRMLEPDLCNGLLDLKQQIENNQPLANRIRSKYKTKNTTGYSLNAFLDFARPVDIFSHLLIGSEGTLAFIAEAVLNTVPDHPLKSTALLLFPTIHAACSAIGALTQAGAAALELMDRASLRSVQDQPGVPTYLAQLPNTAAALLVEFQSANEAQRLQFQSAASEAIRGLDLLRSAEFTNDPYQQAKLWKIRKGMFPSVGAVRAAGTTAIIEDIALPVDRLADGATELITLFHKHGYKNAIIFGHAKDGNLHFVLTQSFNTQAEIDRYARFMNDVVHLVVDRYDGALKAEHGTGRNMAPFVETEWGPEAYAIMQRLKQLTDPLNLLNPGVILNPDPQAHLTDLKQLPVVEPEVDKCIECGFCEHSCPSRDLTLTPRQRIVVRREMQRLKDSSAPASEYDTLDRDFPYMVLDTCAADGLCATDCPVSIDTGKLTKRFRAIRHSALTKSLADLAANHFALAESGARLALRLGHFVEDHFGPRAMPAITQSIDRLSRKLLDAPFWQWTAPMPRPASQPSLSHNSATISTQAAAVYYPACITRIMGALPGEPEAIPNTEAMLKIARRANIKLFIPPDVTGHCCGVPFSSKGFDAANHTAINRIIASFYRWSNQGQIPIVIDTSPCTYGLKTCREHLSAANQQIFDKLQIFDSVEFAATTILPRLTVSHRLSSVALHPVCSATRMGLTPSLVTLAKACSKEVVVPQQAGCCAFAGDRGFLHPELTASATEAESHELQSHNCQGYFSSSRTCEIGMTRATGKSYRSYLHMLEEASRP
jgi:D-lactate dehydrogenase